MGILDGSLNHSKAPQDYVTLFIPVIAAPPVSSWPPPVIEPVLLAPPVIEPVAGSDGASLSPDLL